MLDTKHIIKKKQSATETTRQKGIEMESWVESELQSQGLSTVAKNVQTRIGEIDLIMLDQGQLAFIEVRYRKSDRYGGGLESVNFAKQRKIILSAQFYLMRNPKLYNLPSRFDVISVTGNAENPVMNWIKGAFEVQ